MSITSISNDGRPSDPAKRGKHVAGNNNAKQGATVPLVEPLEPLKPTSESDDKATDAQGEDVKQAALSADETVAIAPVDEKQDDESADETVAIPPVNAKHAEKADDPTVAIAPTDAKEEPAEAEEDADGRDADEQDADEQGDDDSAEDETIPNIAPMASVDAPGYISADIELPSAKRRRGLKVFGITAGIIAAVLVVAYIVGAVVFMGRILPNTIIGDHDISLKSDAEVRETLDNIVADYQLDVIGGGFSYRTTGEDIGLTLDSDGIIRTIHSNLNAWEWPLLIFQPQHDETDLLTVYFNDASYTQGLTDAVNVFNEGATPPVNATIVYDEKTKQFIVKPEEEGTQIDSVKVLAAMHDAIERLDYKLQIGADERIKPTVLSTDEKLIEAAALATGMVSADLTLVMGGQEVGRINGASLSDFITINDKFEVTFREEEMNDWVNNLAYNYDTIGTERSYVRSDGKEIVVPAGGSYGWEIDTEELKNAIFEGIKAGAVAEIQVPCIQEADVYNGVGQRDWGNRYIDVDISEQYVRFYDTDGSIIWEAACISGTPDGQHDTVPGTWYINYTESPSKLIGYENGKKIYETSVTYWMPFEGNGIGFHDATWQPGFGGSMYANGYGSHGCVNLSYSDAQSLYSLVEVGDPVVVHY